MAKTIQDLNEAIVKFPNDKDRVYLVDNGKLRHFTKEVLTLSNQSIFNFLIELPEDLKSQFSIGKEITDNLNFDPKPSLH